MTHADDLRRLPTAAQVLTPLWRREVAELRSWEVRVRDQRPDAVHHLRVATRRLRSALSGFEPLLEGRPTLALNRELRQVAAVLGGGRDVQAVGVQVGALLGEERDALARRLHTSLAGLIDEADVESWKYTLEQLNRPWYDAFIRSLEHFADMPPWLPAADQAAEEVLRPLLADEWSRFRRSVERTMESAPADVELRLHQARKASKRARYVAESLVVVFGRKATRLAKSAEQVQQTLGDYRDLALAQGFLADARHRLSLDAGEALLLTRIEDEQVRALEAQRAVGELALLEVNRKKLRAWLR